MGLKYNIRIQLYNDKIKTNCLLKVTNSEVRCIVKQAYNKHNARHFLQRDELVALAFVELAQWDRFVLWDLLRFPLWHEIVSNYF